MRVQGGVTLEVVIAKYWANLGELTVDYSVEFHGLRPESGPRLAVAAADGVRGVLLRALRQQDVQPAAQLKYAEPVVRYHRCSLYLPTLSKCAAPRERKRSCLSIGRQLD